VLSFLHQVFVEDNVRAIPATELASRLSDQLFALNEREPRSFPWSAREYLDGWASPESGCLRKYYAEGGGEPHFAATPAVERALLWVPHPPSRPVPAPGNHAGRADAPGCTPDSAAHVEPEHALGPGTCTPSSGYAHRSQAPIPVRYASVDPATPGSATRQGDQPWDKEETPR
jgi:hypothetical protein